MLYYSFAIFSKIMWIRYFSMDAVALQPEVALEAESVSGRSIKLRGTVIICSSRSREKLLLSLGLYITRKYQSCKPIYQSCKPIV